MNDTEVQEALVQPSKSFSIVWLLPLIALAIGVWLLYQSITDAPIEITVDFATGTGIEVGKTKVIYEGIQAGVVTDIRLDQSDLKGVVATIEMDNRIEPFLREGTKFWLVKPEISLSGITGLETIVSGNYIAIKIDTGGSPTRYFTALEEPPAVDMSEPGLHLKLLANDLGSVNVGAPLLYKKIVVGRVLDYELDTQQDKVVVSVIVQPPYDQLITQKTRFWNTSGVRVKAGLDGVDVQMDSLLSVLRGGITFDITDPKNEAPARNGDQFKLYRNYSAAQRGITATITFNADDALPSSGARVMFKGFEAGVIRGIKLSEDHRSVIATVNMSPDMEEYLNTGTRFWLAKPQISLQGISGLDTLVKGSYVEMDLGEGEPTREFVALSKPPAPDAKKPGLRLRLQTAERGSIDVGSPVLYRKMPVGVVEAYQLSPQQDTVLIDIRIEPEYRSLVHKGTRFWNASGVQFSGSLSKVMLRTESLASLIQGGIGFYNPDNSSREPVQERALFTLYDDYDSAQEKGTTIDILLTNADGVTAGTVIRYQGIEIGAVKDVQLKADLSGIVARAILHEQPEKFAREGSVFWLVQPKLGITGASHLETLVTGKYFEAIPGSGRPQRSFTAQYAAPVQTVKEQGLNLTLITPRLGSVREGLQVYYRDVVVGKVTGFRLGETADHVKVFINIEPLYAPLVRDGTQFWNASGISIDVGLFKGATIRADSLESILAGGIAFSTPDNGNGLPLARNGETFVLHDQVKEEWLQWRPKIHLATTTTQESK